MNFLKDCCDNACCAQAGNDFGGLGSPNFGGFGSSNFGGFGGSNFGPRRSFSFNRDQFQDMSPAGFRNIGSFIRPSGTLRGNVFVNANGDILGRFTGKFDGFSALAGPMGNLGNLGNTAFNFPFAFQFGDRNL